MAFIAGAVVGGLFTAVVVYAYFYQRITDKDIHIEMLRFSMNNNRIFQESVIEGLQERLKVYEERFGPYQDIIGEEEETE